MVLPTNIASTYPDASASDGLHQQYHDEVHTSINSVVGAYNTAVAGGFAGSIEDWLDQVGQSATGAAGGVLAGTYPNPSFASDMATQAELDAVAAAKVSLAGAETVAGVKTFTSSPVIPAPTTDLQAATKKYVDDNAGGPGGGGGASGVDDLATFNAAYGTALTYDEEFDGTGSTLPTGWSWANQGTATLTHRASHGIITSPAATENWRMLVRSLPTESSWTAYAKLSIGMRAADPGRIGLVVRDSVTGRLVSFDSFGTSAGYSVTPWTSPTAFAPNFVGATAVHSGRFAPLYVRVVRTSATAWTFSVSADGVTWAPLHTGTIDLSGHLTPNQIGFGMSGPTTTPGELGCDWLRVR